MNDSFFRKIESKTGVPMEEVFALANAIQYADFSDERQVRKIVKKVGRMANKDIPPHLEDELVRSILQSGSSFNMNDIQKMLGN
ncbi:stage VI sporulation protein F [Sporosarcina cyprini]|uniref:stage VI sporulation protein F n=1 Tax=Sporosarcina cyprini TaxID=2910523 RepID=UPI001EDDAD33|nr:stage VI sporulation protein F [Sporosarcina cyprini]MCG3089677.1 stage VI sporulation protein F [Sporosarcina cyprini]